MSKKTKILLVVALAIIIVLLVLRLVLGINRNGQNPSPLPTEKSGETVISNYDDAKVFTLTEANYEEQVKNASGVIVIEFIASWAEGCKDLDAVIQKLSYEMENVKFMKVDIDEEPKLSEYFGVVDVLPAVAVMQEGSLKTKIIGVVPESKIRDAINY